MRVVLYSVLFVIFLIKGLLLDRIVMKRFAEDYEAHRHMLPYVIGRWLGQEMPPEY